MNKIWTFIKNFKPSENWGQPNKISGILLFVIDAVRSLLGLPIMLTDYPACPETNSGHSPHSYHYLGMALDAYIGRGSFTVLEVLRNFTSILEIDLQIHNYGLGYYPFWTKYPNGIGIHFDVREKQTFWISPKAGEYIYYHSLTEFLDAVKYYKS
jgi:hypothetical protein